MDTTCLTCKFKLFSTFVFLLLVVLPQRVFSTDMACWQVKELTFSANKSYTEPWNDVNLIATFTGPNSLQYKICGFWDGGQTWKVRFAPTMPGAWSYQTACPQDPGLNGKTGSITVAPAAGNNQLYLHGGFLKISSNGRYLTYSDNTPFFWLGDTWWYSPGNSMPFEGSSNPQIDSCFKHCVSKRKSQGYTIAHFGFLGSLKGHPGPLGFYKTRKIIPEYWQETDKYIQHATNEDIMPQIAMLWVSDLHNTLDDWKTIWKYFIARYGAYPITWDFSTEYSCPLDDLKTIVPLVSTLGQFIKDNDPYKRAMTIMPWWYKGDRHQVWGQPWHDFIQIDGGHEDPYGPPISVFKEACAYNTRTPVILVETVFEEIQRNGYSPHDDTVVRRNFYRAMQLGCAGFTYGSNGLWYPTQNANDHTFEDVWGTALPWWQALERPGGAQMGYLKNFYQSIPWWDLEPRTDSIITDLPLPEDIRILAQATKGDNIIVVYFPNNRPYSFVDRKMQPISVKLQLNAHKNTQYRTTWFDPRKGTRNDSPDLLNVNGATIILPDCPDFGSDWVLLLRENSKGEPK